MKILHVFAVACLSGCVSQNQRVLVKSQPSGAEVRASTGVKGLTPFEFEANRQMKCAVTIHKKGCRPITVELNSVDSKLSPNPVLVRLSPMGSSIPSMRLATEMDWVEPKARPAVTPRSTPSPAVKKIELPPLKNKRIDTNGTEYL